MSSTSATLAAASQDRKARLAQLRSLKRKQPDETNNHTAAEDEQDDSIGASITTEDEDVKSKYLSGRNFDLSTGGAKLGFEHAPDENQETVERKAEALSERVLQEAKDVDKKNEPLDLFKLQPKNPNWDLKRDLKQRMEILDIRTENAIARMVRERIANQKKSADGTGDGEAGPGLEGADLVEAVHVREREELEEQRREKEWEAGLADADV